MYLQPQACSWQLQRPLSDRHQLPKHVRDAGCSNRASTVGSSAVGGVASMAIVAATTLTSLARVVASLADRQQVAARIVAGLPRWVARPNNWEKVRKLDS